MIYLLKDCGAIESLFRGWEETLIWSCLQGHMGQAHADDIDNPKSARLIVADFCFLAGEPNDELLKSYPISQKTNNLIFIPKTEQWENSIEKVFRGNASRIERYATKKEKDVFDKNELEKYSNSLCEPYRLCMIDEKRYHQAMASTWAMDLCSQFRDWPDYQKRGIGVVALENDQILAGASSYTIYDGGIEIEVDTAENFRRKGLAQACCARLILECLDRGLYPSWDAHNKGSLALAQKLGYHFDKAYTAYVADISGYSRHL